MIAAALAVAILAASSPPASARGSTAACPQERGHVIEESQLEVPPDARPTNGRMRFLLDLGSDGRIRRVATVESSGDPAVDAAGAKALAQFRFALPSAGCVTTSSVTARTWSIPPEALASPSPAAGVSGTQAPCVAPFVRPVGFPLPHRREVPGSASMDVGIDASARVTAVHLTHSSGNKKTDYAATVAARNGTYIFERQPGCAPVATTYHLELTFR